MAGQGKGMFTVSVETRFQASHRLTLPDGSIEQVHSHNWLVTAEVCRSRLGRKGLVIDFSQLRAMVDNIISELSGSALLENDYFKRNSPSAENVSRYIYQRLRRKLPKGVKLWAVKVTEEPGCWAGFGG